VRFRQTAPNGQADGCKESNFNSSKKAGFQNIGLTGGTGRTE